MCKREGGSEMPDSNVSVKASGACRAVWLMMTFVAVGGSPAAADGTMYWAEFGVSDGKLSRATFEGSEVEILLDDLSLPVEVELDLAGRKVYWSSGGLSGEPGRLERANLDGSSVETVLELDGDIRGAVIHPSAGIYLTADLPGAGNDKVLRVDLDGSNLEEIVTGIHMVGGIDVDPANEKVYWTEFLELNGGPVAPGQIRRAGLDGSNVEIVIGPGFDPPGLVAVDPRAGKLYWVTFTDCSPCNMVRRADLDGGNEELLINGISVADFELELESQKMYWTSTFGIDRANLDGSAIETVLSTESTLGIALDPFDVGDPVPATSPLAVWIAALAMLLAAAALRRRSDQP